MSWRKTNFEDVWVFEPKIWGDHRGYFLESYNEAEFKKTGLDIRFVQDNEAKSSKGILRGLHYQNGSSAQSKLVRVVSGEVLDVIVDIRPGSKTYGQHLSIVLNDITKKQLFVPKGFAHGYVVLSDEAVFVYKVDTYYDVNAECAINYNCDVLNIDWAIDPSLIKLADKDKNAPTFENHTPFSL